MSADATELFQEGIRLPVQPVLVEGRWNDGLLEVLAANSRIPEKLVGDLRAQIAACNLGVIRLREACERFGVETFVRHAEAFVDYSDRLVQQELLRLSPGTYSATRYIDNPPSERSSLPLHVTANVTVSQAHDVHVDFSQSSPQTDRPINVVMSNSIAGSLIAVRSFLDPEIPMNGGLQRHVTVSCAPGLIMNPILPVPVSSRALTVARAFNAVMDCLGQACPERAVADSSGGTTMPYIWVQRQDGQLSSHILVDNSLTGGMGARNGGAGHSAVDNSVTNAMNYPAEAIEQEYPVRVDELALRDGSGGNGQWPGGDGLRRVVRFLRPGLLSLRGHSYQFPPAGVQGGQAGEPARFSLWRQGQRVDLSPTDSHIATEAGDILVAETPGGGGYGPPEPANSGAQL
jgi:N-methylhydantoinase B